MVGTNLFAAAVPCQDYEAAGAQCRKYDVLLA